MAHRLGPCEPKRLKPDAGNNKHTCPPKKSAQIFTTSRYNHFKTGRNLLLDQAVLRAGKAKWQITHPRGFQQSLDSFFRGKSASVTHVTASSWVRLVLRNGHDWRNRRYSVGRNARILDQPIACE